jgi:hypothetical protein
MPRAELLCNLAGIKSFKFSKEENIIIEAELFSRLIDKVIEYFKEQHKVYLCLVKLNKEMEVAMFGTNFIRCIINDILSTEEYTLSGIAYYTQTPEDIVYEVSTGSNCSPSIDLFRKIIELHRSVRSDLYRSITEKIISEYTSAKQELSTYR